MGKVRYKEPSDNFKKLYTQDKSSNLRFSIGNEKSIGEYYYLSIDCLIPYAKQARRVFNEDEIKELADTISEYGVQSPLLVIPSELEENKFEVVSGERRLKAASLINLEKVPCIIINKETAEEVALIENIQRSQLHPIEIGDALQAMMIKSSWGDVTKIAKKLGKTQSTISTYLSYAKLPSEIKEHLIINNITSRDFLRRLIKIGNIREMKSEILSIRIKKEKSESSNLLRIIKNKNGIHVQDKNLYKVSVENRNEIINKIKEILKKLENIAET